MKKISLILTAACLFILAACSGPQTSPEGTADKPQAANESVELMVLAAASLTDALNSLKNSYEESHPGVKLTYSFGSSGKLAQQIEQGAPADLFLSASQADMDKLDENQLLLPETRVDFSGNSLVLITAKENGAAITSFEELTDSSLQHIAVGAPESVPAGRYTKEVLDNLKLWDSLSDRLVFGSDVRQVLTFVESGNAEVGVVYSSDAATSEKVKVLAEAKVDLHKPIVYPGAVVRDSAHAEAAKQFLSYLASEEGKKALQEYGFR